MKPDVMCDYKKTMGGVDSLSRVIIPYSIQRKTMFTMPILSGKKQTSI